MRGGHKVNEALSGRILSILLSARYGTLVGIETNAYRILLQLPRFLRAVDVDEALCSLDPRHVEVIFMLALKKTALYKWKLVQIAKKFGAIDADTDYEKISINWLMDLFDNTIIEREALQELFFANMDVANAREVVQRLLDHRMETTTRRLSIIDAEGAFHRAGCERPSG